MDIVTSIPVRVKTLGSASILMDRLQERITQRAYKIFVDRGGSDGQAVEDWLQAERELIIAPEADVRKSGEDIQVELKLPNDNCSDVNLYVTPFYLVVQCDDPQRGQVFSIVELPEKIQLDGVDAEQLRDMLRVTAVTAGTLQAQMV